MLQYNYYYTKAHIWLKGLRDQVPTVRHANNILYNAVVGASGAPPVRKLCFFIAPRGIILQFVRRSLDQDRKRSLEIVIY
jgi:hypothetical protein